MAINIKPEMFEVVSKHISIYPLIENGFSHSIPVTAPIGKNGKGIDELILLEDFSFWSGRTNKIYTAKAGFIFDGASIPKFFWRIIGHPFSSDYIRSALIHDILYMSETGDRKLADQIFKDMLKVDYVASWKIYPMYSAVRVGGGSVYEDHKRAEVKEAQKFISIQEK